MFSVAVNNSRNEIHLNIYTLKLNNGASNIVKARMSGSTFGTVSHRVVLPTYLSLGRWVLSINISVV